ncbi:unnamed protein product [Lampetra fluviatilis]
MVMMMVRDGGEEEEVPSPPPEYKGDICKAHAEGNAHLYDWLVWEFSHRYPTHLTQPASGDGGKVHHGG